MSVYKTRFRVDLDEVTLGRKPFNFRRPAAEIQPNRLYGAPSSPGVAPLPGGVWSLAPFNGDLGNIVTDDYSDAPFGTGAQGMLIPGGFTEMNMFNSMNRPGAVEPASAVTAGSPSFGKQREAGANWDTQRLTSDQTAYPSPSAIQSAGGGNMFPADRALCSTATYAPNTGFYLVTRPLQDYDSLGYHLNMMFGGNTQMGAPGSTGGAFSVALNQGGFLQLWERDDFSAAANKWEPRETIPFSNPGLIKGRQVNLFAIPYGRNRIAFMSGVLSVFSFARLITDSTYSVPANAGFRYCHEERYLHSGHTHMRHMTGQGALRIDTRRTVRKRWSAGVVKYPAVGYLTDLPFSVKGPVGIAVRMTITPSYYLSGAGESLVVDGVYNAKTHVELTYDPVLGGWLTDANQWEYYVRFKFTASADRLHSPILYGYQANINGTMYTRTGAFQTGGNIQSISITPQGKELNTASASLTLKDPKDALTILRNHDGFRADICLYDGATIISRLHEGQISEPEAKYMVSAQSDSRYSSRRDYDGLQILDIAARLGEQVPISPKYFNEDPTAPEGPDGRRPPWRVAAIIEALLNDCGVQSDEIDIPTYYQDIRLFESPTLGRDDYHMPAGGDQPYLRMIQHLCKDYLGAIMVRDPNAGPTMSGSNGPRGMWRILMNPTSATTSLWTFLSERPAGAGVRLGSAGETWGTGATFIEKYTFSERVIRPEVNYVCVRGIYSKEDGIPRIACENAYMNFKSHLFYADQPVAPDPTHPDYLGRLVPVYIVDPGLYGQYAVDWMMYRVAHRAAHAERRVRWRAPLVLGTVAGDTHQVLARKLQINDVVTIQRPSDLTSHKIIIKSCVPDYSSDYAKMAWYDGVYLT